MQMRRYDDDDDELGEELSSSFFITPGDARLALQRVGAAAKSLNTDMQAAAGTLPPGELSAWNQWYADFVSRYGELTGSLFDWRLIDSKGALEWAESNASDLSEWRSRYMHFAGKPPVAGEARRLEPGPGPSLFGDLADIVKGVAILGGVALVVRIYKDIKR